MGRQPKYSEEIKAFIAENVAGRTTKELAALVNARFNTDFTESKMKSYKQNHKLRSGTPGGLPAGLPTELYPEKVKAFISEHYVDVGYQAMADLLNQTFGTSYTNGQIRAYYKNNRLDSGLKGYFKKGHVPFNKGTKGLTQGGEQTQFKPGDMPHNWVPVGSERVTGDGYVAVKIQDGKLQKNWKCKHHIIWEEVNGVVPEGHALIFADGDRLNVALDNLILVSKGKLAVLNQKKLISKTAELTKTGVIIADVLLKIGEREKADRQRIVKRKEESK